MHSLSDPLSMPPTNQCFTGLCRVGMALAILALLASCAVWRPTATPAQPQPAAVLIDTSNITAKHAPSGLPEAWNRGVFMQIFVRAYQDSDGDGIGDLKGLTQRLDYLKDLGVSGLWLMPITPSADKDHGYATIDFRAIDPAFGSLADFDALIREAHQRGMGVIMDYTPNHSAAEHPLFVASRQGTTNLYRDWYVWSDAAPQGWSIGDKNPWYHAAAKPWEWKGKWEALPAPPVGAKGHYFGTFGGDMPDFNWRNPKVVDFHISNLRFWLNRGLDGFRLEAVPHLIENDAQRWNDQPESRQMTALLAQEIKAYPGRYVVCEATQQPQAYGAPALCGGAFAFEQAQHFAKAARGDQTSIKELATYFRSAPASMATFVSNHDGFAGARLWDQVEGDTTAYKLAAAGYLLLPGTPFIYYGEEIGQAGLKPAPPLNADQLLRAPMSWAGNNLGTGGFTTGTPFRALAPNASTQNADAQRIDRESIHTYYKDLIALRKSRPSLAKGEFESPFANRLVLGYQRVLDDERTLVLVNYGKTRIELEVNDLPRRARMAPVFPRRAGSSFVTEVTLADSRGRARVSIPPRSIRVFDVEQRTP